MVNWTLMNSIPTIQEIELESSLTYKRYITPCIKNLKYHHYLQVRSAPTHRPRYIVPTACLEPVAPRTVILHNVSICTLFKYILLLRHSKILNTGIVMFWDINILLLLQHILSKLMHKDILFQFYFAPYRLEPQKHLYNAFLEEFPLLWFQEKGEFQGFMKYWTLSVKHT